jgi:ABC-type lipoprotein release transport system permease subunit
MIPASYTVRNLWNHKVTSGLTILGVTLVVFVFAAVLMLANGLFETLVATGAEDNAIVIREASQSEVTSIIMRDQADIVSTFPEIAVGEDGLPLYSNEVYVLIMLDRRDGSGGSNVVVRGVTENSLAIRPHVKLVAGRMFQPGTAEIIAAASIGEKFDGAAIGETVRFGSRDWEVVGLFDAGGTAFDSEIWGDIEQMMDAFKRPVYSSLTLKLSDPTKLASLRERVEKDPRLPLEIMAEKDYYEAQSKFTTQFILIVGVAICIIFSIGAIVGAAITMYAAVANRTKEIATLRSLGFSRFSILVTFLFESILISVVGGLIGLVAASFLRFIEVSTVNFNTFSELAFNFEVSIPTAISAVVFALVMGIVGGFFPAVRASRLKIVDSLRAT